MPFAQHFIAELARQQNEFETFAKNANTKKMLATIFPTKRKASGKNCGGECLFMKGWRMNKHIGDSHSQSSIFHSKLVTNFPRKFCCERAPLVGRLFIMFEVINAARKYDES